MPALVVPICSCHTLATGHWVYYSLPEIMFLHLHNGDIAAHTACRDEEWVEESTHSDRRAAGPSRPGADTTPAPLTMGGKAFPCLACTDKDVHPVEMSQSMKLTNMRARLLAKPGM